MEESPYLDYSKDIRVKEKHLILWDQVGKIQYVTFHLNDSIPQQEKEYLTQLKEHFEKLHPKPWDKETQKEYYNLVGKKQDLLLDNGYGSCLFRNPKNRKILEDSVNYNNGKYYFLISCVIMPNHVHMLLIMHLDYNIEDVIGNLKRYVSTKINKLEGRKGEIWYKENYCRLMRSEEHFKFTRSYIKENPKHLKKGEYSYWEPV